MSLRFILGTSGSGKSSLCLEEITSLQQKNIDKNLIYIVPEQFSLQAERDLIKWGTSGSIMQAQVLSFNRLAYNIFSETGLSKKEGLTDMGKSLLIKKTIMENADSLLYFKKAADKTSFAEQTGRIITEFFKYGITDETLLSKLEGIDENSVLSMKMKDMALIYSKYAEKLHESFSSSDETLDVLYGKIEKSSLVKNSCIWIDGFYGFTPQETKIIEKLLLLADEVNITLTINEESIKNNTLPMTSVFFEPKETYNLLTDVAKGINVPVSQVILKETKRFASPSLAALEKGFALYNPSQFKGETDIEIHYADNINKEVEYTACKILSLVQEKGLRYKDIAVLTGGLDSVDSLIRSTFDECHIPYFMDNKRDMTRHPLILLLLSLMDMVVFSMNSNSVFSFLKTGLIPMERKNIERLENYVLRYGIKGWKWDIPSWQYGIRNAEDIKKTDEINAIKDEFFAIISPFREKIGKHKKYTSAQISEAILSFIDENNILSSLDAISEGLKTGAGEEDYFENRRCWNIVCSIMDTLHNISGSDTMTLEEYRALFENAALSTKIGIIPPGTDNITVGDVDRTRLHDVKALFILGANEGRLPAQIGENGVFAESERETLEKSGMRMAHNSKRRTFEEQFILYSAITKPSHMLFVSCSMGTYDGKTLTPSSVIAKIKKIFPDVKQTSSADEECMFSSANLTFHRLGEKMQSGIDTLQWAQAYKYFTENENWQRRIKLLEKASDKESLTEKLDPDITEKVFRNDLYSSISRLERFATCPYYYFADYILKAKERPLYTLASPDLGTIFHGVLKDFFEGVKEKGMAISDISQQYIFDEAQKSLIKQSELLGKDIFESQSSMKYLLKRLRRISARSISTLCSQMEKGQFMPYAFELSFGSGQILPPVVIETSKGRKLILNGQIDRLDVYEKDGTSYVRIIDYKSGKKQFSLQDAFYGLQLQLLIYIDAVVKSGKLKGQNFIPAGVFYFRIKDPVVDSDKNITLDDIEHIIKKELKLSGLVLSDTEVLSAMDPYYAKSGGSEYLPVSVNKDGTFSKNSSVADKELFSGIIEKTLKTAGDIGTRIQSGYIKPYPYRQGNKTPCSYCPYSALCGFDSTEHKYRFLKSLDKEEVRASLRKESEEN